MLDGALAERCVILSELLWCGLGSSSGRLSSSVGCDGKFLRLWVRKLDPRHYTHLPLLSGGFHLLSVSQSAQVLLLFILFLLVLRN